MSYVHRRWYVALIIALSSVILFSVRSSQVRADSTDRIHPLITATASRTPTRTPTATKTPFPPFNCSLLALTNKRLFGNQFRIDIQNDNPFEGYITRVQLVWPNIPAYAQTALVQMSINTVANWTGSDPQVAGEYSTTTDTNTKQGNPPFSSTSTSVRLVNPLEANVYAATFSGPPLLSAYVSANLYSIVITVDSALNLGAPCVLSSLDSPPTATSTPGGQPSPTPTPTPDCASGLIAIRFNSYDNFGIVRFDILSQRTTTSTLTGFNINWQKYVNSQRLLKVSLVALPGITGSVVVWDSGNVNQDASPPTNSQTEGSWLINFTVPPGAAGSPSVTPLYVDFEGIYRYDDYITSTNPRYGGSSDFNYSTFEFTCDSGGSQPVVQVTPEVIPSPTPFPTVTTTPEFMIRNYFTTHTPTLTWTPITWAVRYEIQISMDKNFATAQTIIAFVPATTLSYTTSFLSDGTFYWRVRALDAKDNSSGWSDMDSFYIAPPPTAGTGN